jgi:glucokinase
MLLAGDIGATKTLLGVFDPQPARPRAIVTRSFGTLDYPSFPEMLEEFTHGLSIANTPIESACFGVAGPILGNTAQLTNAEWAVDGPDIAERLGLGRVELLNDLQAMAYAIPVLDASEVQTLQVGEADRRGNIALIAAGTGLGEALLHSVDGQYVPVPSEAGHADFAARNEREIQLLRWLNARYGRAGLERVVSGLGLVNLHRAVHRQPCRAVDDLDGPGAAARVTAAALENRCESCREALEIFVEAYGAEAGNLALRSLSTGGLFIGGGIAPKILPAMTDGRFMRAFLDKAPFDVLLAKIPVKIILNAETALLGAAVHARALRVSRS